MHFRNSERNRYRSMSATENVQNLNLVLFLHQRSSERERGDEASTGDSDLNRQTTITGYQFVLMFVLGVKHPLYA